MNRLFRIFFTLIISIIFPLFALAEGAWRHYPAFFKDVAQIIDTPTATYLLLHGDHYSNTSSDFKNPVISLFSWNPSEPESLPQPVTTTCRDIRFAQYSRQGKCLVIVYLSGIIDLVYDDGRVESIREFDDIALPYDKTINSLSLDDVTPTAYVATGSGLFTIDLAEGAMSRYMHLERDIEWAAFYNGITYTVENGTLYQATGAPETVTIDTKFIPVSVIADLDTKPSGVTDITRLLPVNNGLAMLQSTATAGRYRVSLLAEGPEGDMELYTCGELPLLLTDAKMAPAGRDQSAVSGSSEGYVFETADALYRFYSGVYPEFDMFDSREEVLDDFLSFALRRIEKPRNGAMAGAWNDSRIIQYVAPDGFNTSGFCYYEKSRYGSVYEEKRNSVRPNAPLAAVCDNMTWHPRYGVMIANHGNSVLFTQTGEQTPARVSLFRDNVWTPYQHLLDPPAFVSNATYASTWKSQINRYPVTFPRGLAIDPDNDRFVYTGSWFYGIARYDLDNRKDPVLRMGHSTTSGYTLPGFKAIAPKQKASATMCLFTNPSFDSDGTLWSAYFNIDGNSTGTGFQLWYWKRDDRAAAAEAAMNPSLVSGWGHLTMPDLRFHGNGRLLALRHPDNRNRIVAYSNNYDSPLVVYDHKGTLEDTSDDVYVQHPVIYNKEGAVVNKVRIYCVAEHPVTGEVWMGTDIGCFKFRTDDILKDFVVQIPLVERIKGQVSDGSPFEVCSVSAIDFDSDGNVWIGSGGNGLFCLTADGKEMLQHFKSDVDPIPHDFVYGLCWNPDNHSVVMSTGYGISEYFTAGLPADDLELKARVYPAHVTPGYKGYITFSNLPSGVAFTLINSEGLTKMRFEPTTTGQIQWDGRDEEGNYLPTDRYRLMSLATGVSIATIDFMK